jgi:hypothetical protein
MPNFSCWKQSIVDADVCPGEFFHRTELWHFEKSFKKSLLIASIWHPFNADCRALSHFAIHLFHVAFAV